MAYVSEKMDENKISFLANEIAKTYMTGKMGSQQEFIETYLEVYESAKRHIVEREMQKKNAASNLSFGDVMSDSYSQSFSDTKQTVSKLL